MSKKQAYETICYLVAEAKDAITIADFPDIKTAIELLSTANYMRRAFQLKEDDEIRGWIEDVKEEIYELIKNYSNSLNSIWI